MNVYVHFFVINKSNTQNIKLFFCYNKGMQKAIEVNIDINNNKLNKTFTYLITSEEFLQLKIGMTVIVDFNRRDEIGFVNKIIEVDPDDFSYKLKPIKMIALEQSLTDEQIHLIEYLMFNFNVSAIEAINLVYPRKMRKIKKSSQVITVKPEVINTGYKLGNRQIEDEKLQGLVKIFQIYHLLRKKDLQKLDKNLNDYQINKAVKLEYLKKIKEKSSKFDLLKEDFNEKILTENQLSSLGQLRYSKKDALLYGTMGSGKTEVIKYLFRDLQENEQILILEPNQLLRDQIFKRLKDDFSSQVVLYDQTSSNASVVYEQIKNNNARIIVGLANSIFAPFSNLRLVVHDEEHDFNYDANEVEFKTKSVLNYLQMLTAFKIIYTSATPSLLTMYEAKKEKLSLVNLKEKYYDTNVIWGFSEIDSYDTYLTSKTLLKIRERLAKGEKVIILHNRLGYATNIECETCLRIPVCPHCQKPLSYFQDSNLKCRYCNYKVAFKNHCSRCNKDNSYKMIGAGIEQVYETLKKYFNNYPIYKIDSTTKIQKRAEIIKEFSINQPQILLGTSLIASGVDFQKISLAVVTNIDYSLNTQNYDRELSAFQLLKQLSGRVGKLSENSEILIQTKHPNNRMFQLLQTDEYDDYVKEQMNNRYLLNLPPFTKYFKITLFVKNEYDLANDVALLLNYLGPKYKIMYRDYSYVKVKRIGNEFYTRYEICFEIPKNFNANHINSLKGIELRKNSFMRFNPNFTNIT